MLPPSHWWSSGCRSWCARSRPATRTCPPRTCSRGSRPPATTATPATSRPLGTPRPAGRRRLHRRRRPVRRPHPAAGVVAGRRRLAGRPAARDRRDRPRPPRRGSPPSGATSGTAPRPASTRGIRLPRTADLRAARAGRAAAARRRTPTTLPGSRLDGSPGGALGLRLVPAAPQSSIDHVDLWADPDTGVPLRVEVYGAASRRRRSPASSATSPADAGRRSAIDFDGAVRRRDRTSTTSSTSRTPPTSTRRSLPPDELAGLPQSATSDWARSGSTARRHPADRDPAARPGGRRRCASSCGRRPGCRAGPPQGTVVSVGPLGVLLTGEDERRRLAGHRHRHRRHAAGAARDLDAGVHELAGATRR